jgi:hypothetical protein
MNDRFKFRIFIKNEPNPKYNGMFKVHSLHLGTNKVIISSQHGNVSVKLDSNKILMQSTGLKDKNGKLIYEGDILGGIYENLDIFYCKECRQFELHANGYGCMCCNGDIHWCEVVEDNNELEVVGNIYENPELLEE